MSELRACFDEALHLTGVCPENSLYFVALGAAHQPSEPVLLNECLEAIEAFHSTESYNALPPLFADEEELAAFRARHAKAQVNRRDPAAYTGDVYLGIDSGSTTIKSVVITPDGRAAADPLPEQQRRSRAACAQFSDRPAHGASGLESSAQARSRATARI